MTQGTLSENFAVFGDADLDSWGSACRSCPSRLIRIVGGQIPGKFPSGRNPGKSERRRPRKIPQAPSKGARRRKKRCASLPPVPVANFGIDQFVGRATTAVLVQAGVLLLRQNATWRERLATLIAQSKILRLKPVSLASLLHRCAHKFFRRSAARRPSTCGLDLRGAPARRARRPRRRRW